MELVKCKRKAINLNLSSEEAVILKKIAGKLSTDIITRELGLSENHDHFMYELYNTLDNSGIKG